ncbi:protein SHI RELATED SEQUENCE 6 isoform X2 [Carica papaya]|uniref:protein SHI RELATED SEQUENCE 6 isoform X2 n=1 Tax=Carica papaya TaxID=3649 RepID=UPI000B8CCBDD|nr:protein SHI RELATED SEQUENCE 6 isoform X2 [Carica papaya]
MHTSFAHHDQPTMLGLHNILLIAPSHPNHPPNTHQTEKDHVGLGVRTAETDDHEGDDDLGCVKACRDCGNRAKKECGYGRCRTCCKTRGYDCVTHLKSTWVPAARRREKQAAASASTAGAGDSSGSSSCGVKRSRMASASDNNTCFRFETSFAQQGQVRAPAVFRCIRVTAIADGKAEVGYQATVNISGHVFKGFLYDHGVDENNLLPCISKLQFQSGRNSESSSPPIVGPHTAYVVSNN